LGAVLFSGEEGAKKLGALSGGEAARLMFARLSLERPNVLVLDEPTNHLDLESIEALVAALADYEGTLILVSHDRWFVSRLATRIVEIRPDGIRDYPGTYQEYVHALGDDHLDADAVLSKRAGNQGDASREGTKERSNRSNGAGRSRAEGSGSPAKRTRKASPSTIARRREALERERDATTESITLAESRLQEIDDAFCAPDFYDRADPDEVAALENERGELVASVESGMKRWEELELELKALARG
ncbi:MAG: ATP-binding cassette domain-containing protein, partial [Gemmatimonadetes bacterium]|nr:ATP-binding cassette domain-containing protein [Gemmatimonadota bacterium]